MLVDQEEYRGHTIEVHTDENPLNPREEFHHFGTMVCWHGRYDLGDKHSFSTPDDALAHFRETQAIVLPLYLYDHSGISISTRHSYPYDDPWDAGQVGWIYAERAQVLREYEHKRMSQRICDAALVILQSEVQEYNYYLTGQIYGYEVKDSKGEYRDGCWGFYGDTDYMLQEAKASVDASIKQLDIPFPETREEKRG